MNLELSVIESDPVASARPVPPATPPAPVRSASYAQQIIQYVAVAVLAILSYFFISHWALQSIRVVGASMTPTLHDSDYCFLNRWVYHVRAPQRGEVVVIKDPSDGTYAVKRIIALAGEVVYLKDGVVYVNGTRLDEAYLAHGTKTFTASPEVNSEWIACGKEQYFVMGDNRNNSFDSRMYGPISRANIVGTLIR